MLSRQIWNEGWAGGGFNLPQPFIERLLAEAYAVNQACIADAHQYRSALRIGEGNQRFNRGFVKAGLELHGLGFAGEKQGVKGHRQTP